MSDKSDRHLYHKYETLNLAKMGTVGGGISGGGINHSPPLSRATSPLNHDYDNGLKVWHLVSFSFVFLKSFKVLWNPLQFFGILPLVSRTQAVRLLLEPFGTLELQCETIEFQQSPV